MEEQFRLLTDEEVEALHKVVRGKLAEVIEYAPLALIAPEKFVERLAPLTFSTVRLCIDIILRQERGVQPADVERNRTLAENLVHLQKMDDGWVEAADSFDNDDRIIDPPDEYTIECEECDSRERCMVWLREHGVISEDTEPDEVKAILSEFEDLLEDIDVGPDVPVA